MSTFDTIAARLAVCDTPEALDALGRVLARQFAAAGNDAALFRLRLALDERRATIARRMARRRAAPRSPRSVA